MKLIFTASSSFPFFPPFVRCFRLSLFDLPIFFFFNLSLSFLQCFSLHFLPHFNEMCETSTHELVQLKKQDPYRSPVGFVSMLDPTSSTAQLAVRNYVTLHARTHSTLTVTPVWMAFRPSWLFKIRFCPFPITPIPLSTLTGSGDMW